MSTTERSFNETGTMVRKACIGAGCPHGVAEEIGRAAVWLHRNGADGVGAALAALDDVPQWSAAPATDGSVLVFENARAAVCGASGIDHLVAAETGEVRMLSTDVPLLIVGLAGVRAGQAGLSLRILLGGAEIIVGNSVDGLASATLSNGPDLSITRLDNSTESRPNPPPCTVATVDRRAWSRCEKLAARTLVPATEESRQKGAGGSHTDND